MADVGRICAIAISSAPTVNQTLADQTTLEDSVWSFAFPAETFADQDAADALTYTASRPGVPCRTVQAIPNPLKFISGGSMGHYKSAIAAGLSICMCVGCGGGGPQAANGGESPTTTAPVVGAFLQVVASPSGVQSRDSLDLRWAFSGAVAPSTSSPANFQLLDSDGNSIPVKTTIEGGSSVRLSPREPLGLMMTYTLRVSTNVQGVAGDRLGAEIAGNFRVADGQWHAAPPSLLVSASDPTYGADAAGNLFVARQAFNGARFTVALDRLDAATGQWSSVQLDPDPPPDGSLFPSSVQLDPHPQPRGSISPQVAVSGSGWVAVIWRTLPNASGVKGRVFDPTAATWGPVMNLGAGDNAFRNPAVAVDEAGNVTVVKPLYDGFRHDVEAMRLAPGSSSWGPPVSIASDLVAFTSARLAIDPDSSVTALLYFSSGPSSPMVHRAARYSPASSQWSALRSLEAVETLQWFQRFTNAPGQPRGIVLRNADAGASIFGFEENSQQWVLRSMWSESPAERGFGSWVADSKGRAVRVDSHFDPALGISEARVRHSLEVPAGIAWSVPLIARSAPGQQAANVRLAGDDWGNAVVVWSENGPFSMTVWAQRFVRSEQAWGSPVVLGRGTSFGTLALATLPNGRFLASWTGGANPMIFR